MHTTPLSLLERLREPSQADAWPRFVELYTPLFFYWARRLAPQESDTSDLVQDVFATLVVELPQFSYRADKRFRGWLWTVMLNRWRQLQRRRTPSLLADAELDSAMVPDDTHVLDDDEYRGYLVNRCMQLMKSDFQPVTWKACWAHVVDAQPAAAVAADLGISVNAVHLAKSRVLRRLREELQGLLD